MNILIKIIPDVIRDRQLYVDRNLSCKKGSNPQMLLKEIIKEDVYKSDYLIITNRLIYKPVHYEQCVKSISEIIESGIVPELIN